MSSNNTCRQWLRFLVVSLLALQLVLAGGPAARADWVFSYPPNQVKLDSGHRNNVFYVGDTVKFNLIISNYGTYALTTPITYEVRDYWGNVVDSGTAPAPTPTKNSLITSDVTLPGWYKINLHGGVGVAPWGDSVGSAMFEIFRPNANFPLMPSPTLPNNSTTAEGVDEVVRGVTGMGPQRHAVSDASKPAQAFALLDAGIAQDKQYYTPYRPAAQPRPLMIAFPNGVGSSDPVKQAANLAGLTQLVASITTTMSNTGSRSMSRTALTSGADYVNKELKPFYRDGEKCGPYLQSAGAGLLSLLARPA